MFDIRHRILGLALFALLLTACQPLQTPSAAEFNTAAPSYIDRGPFAVGFRTEQARGETADGAELETLEIHAWYPTAASDDTTAAIAYAAKLKDATWSPAAPPIVHGQALRNAAVDGTQGALPLVVFSHGFMLSPAWYSTLAEHLASHGFVVLAPDHVEQFDPSLAEMWKTLIDRPQDVVHTLDLAEALTAGDGEWAGLIDMENVAVVGHSYGGYTALAAAGAQYDMQAYKERCAALATDDPLAFFCMPIVPHEAAMAERTGLSGLPDGLWPQRGDRRVSAIISMAGDSYLFGEAGLSQITVPVMAIAGDADTGTPLDWGAAPTYAHAASAEKALVLFEGAEHMIYATPCEKQPWIGEHPYAPYFCTDPAWDKQAALDLIHHFSTVFLLHTLRDDPAARAALSPEAVKFDGIGYTATLE